MPLVLVALLGAAGCVSVEAGGGRPAPEASVSPGNAPAAQTSTPPTAPPAVHDALGKTEERPERASGKKRKKEEEGTRTPARRPDTGVPPVHEEVRSGLGHVAPAPPEPPRRAQPYDMRAVCATGRGVAPPEIVDLCSTTYGR